MNRSATNTTRPVVDIGGTLEALRVEVAELRALVAERLPAPDGDLISTTVAGRLIGKSSETVRRWALAHGIGVFSPAGGAHLISRKRLAAYLLRTTGEVPETLR
jgi:hypothetical protein